MLFSDEKSVKAVQKPKPLQMGSTKNLSRSEAIEQYVVLRMRTEEINRLDYLLKTVKYKRVTLPDDSPYSVGDLSDTLRTAFFGWFATLTDRNPKAMYAFNCLYFLFPSKANQILQCQISLEACNPELQQFRNNVAFHARAEVSGHVVARSGLRGTDAFLDLCSAVGGFQRLMDEVEIEELEAIPNFPEVLQEFGVAHLAAFVRSLARRQTRDCDLDTISDKFDSCSLLP